MDDLLLLSGNDIPFIEAKLSVHPPKIKEIAYIGEENFFIGCEFLNFSKNIMEQKDKDILSNKSNFEILMSIMKEKSVIAQRNKNCALLVLMLLFPNYDLYLLEDKILLKQNEDKFYIDNSNFESFKKILVSIFCLGERQEQSGNYNPANEAARKIAEKLQKNRNKVAKMKGENKEKISILGRYLSVLAVGESKDINELFNYTFYQLQYEFQRFILKQDNDMYIKAKLAGAKDLKEVENWMKDIHL